MPHQKTFVIIDGNAIIHRAYHAIPPFTTKEGTLVNAVYGFASMLLKVLSDLKPTYLAVSFDLAGPTFRDKLYDAYKAKRVKADQDLYDQIPFVHEVVETFGIPMFVKEGYEADDVIGTIVTKLKKKKDGIVSIIVTGDKDMLQLVDDKKTEVYLLKKGLSEFELYDEDKVRDVFGFGPEQMVDYKALRGDTSDNIPGVKGIGEKTAKDLIQNFGSLDGIYRALKKEDTKIKPAVAQKLKDDEQNARMSQELSAISVDIKGIEADLEAASVKEFDHEKLRALFQKYEFISLLNRVPGVETEKAKKVQHFNGRENVQKVTSKTIDPLLALLKNHDIYFCKTVVDGNDIFSAPLRGFVFVVNGKSFFLELNSGEGIPKKLVSIFEDKNKLLIGHDLKYAIKVLRLHKVDVKNKLFDVMIASYVLNSSSRLHEMRSIVLRELGTDIGDAQSQQSLFGIDPAFVAREGKYCFEIYKKQHKQLEDEENFGLFESVEMALVPVLAKMELHGIAVDVVLLNSLSKKATATIEKLTKQIHKEAGKEFNIASSIQLRDILFDTLKLPTERIKKGKTGYSTASPELQKLYGLHPIIELIEEYREVAKLQNTYTDVLPALVNKTTGRIHTDFNQVVATTGRLSSSDPNLQNIPIRTELGREIRRAFISEKGFVLVSADYSQIELRIAASLAKDKTMLEIFESGKDIHTATAAVINGVTENNVTKEMRYAAKAINFGILYGMGAYGLSWRTQIPQWEAKEFIKKYFEKFSGIKKYIDETLKFAKEEGYVETLFGRRRYIPELQSDNFQLRSAGERMAVNMPIQGTAADLMKMAMIAVQQKIEKHKEWNDSVRLLLQVHDELVLEVKKGLEDEVLKMVEHEMKHVAELRVPIEVNTSVGTRWGDMK